ncbi:MAG: hypothetical protein RLZZ227_2876 [Pseudomonadota bacterium]|jgi:cytoskeleton protein RodZ
MSEPLDKTVESDTQARDFSRSTPGEYLRKLREEKGLTHTAVGAALHLTVHYVKALEGDDYGKLPGLTFVKGYLRSYASFLGADVDKVIAQFDEHITGLLDAGLHTARVQRSRQRQDQALRWAIGAGFVVVAGIAAGWWYMSGTDVPAARETAAIVAPPPSQAAALPARSTAPAANSVVTSQPGSTSVTMAIQTPAVVIPPALASTFTAARSNSAAGANGVVASNAGLAATTYAPAAMNAPGATAGFPTANLAPANGPALTESVVAAPLQGTTSAQPAAPPAQGAIAPASPNAGLTIIPNAAGARLVSLISTGDDELRVTFNGNSWIEVDDGSMVRLYNDELAAGDTLTIRGKAPFRVLVGDARQVSLSLNAAAVDISSDIRTDSTARLVIGAPASTEAPL